MKIMWFSLAVVCGGFSLAVLVMALLEKLFKTKRKIEAQQLMHMGPACGSLDTVMSWEFWAKSLVADELRKLYPVHGYCYRCKWPWPTVKHHTTQIGANGTRGIFALCEMCWKELGNADNRIPYYRMLLDSWRKQGVGHVDEAEADTIVALAVEDGKLPPKITVVTRPPVDLVEHVIKFKKEQETRSDL